MAKKTLSGIPKVPVIMQQEALECGAVSLAMILAYFGKWLPIERIRADCDISRDGSTAKNILRAAKGYGLDVDAYKLEPEELREDGEFPCIIHWNLNHFVVLKGFKGNKAFLNDPAYGDYSVSMETFDRSFTGICLFFKPNESFVADGQRKSIWSFAKKRLKNSNTEIAAILMISIILLLVGIINPLFAENFIDWCLDSSIKSNAVWFFAVFSLVGVISILGEWFKAYYLLKIDGKMSVIGNTSYIWKVLNLPMNFFSQRLPGDIQLRQAENAEVSTRLVQIVAPMLINTIVTVFYLAIMIWYSPVLALIGVVSVAVNVLFSTYSSRKRINLTRVQMMEQGQLYSTTTTGIDMIETLKASSAEDMWVEQWSNSLTSFSNSEIKLKILDLNFGTLPQLITSLTNVAVIAVGALLVVKGSMSVGMLIAFQGFMAMFLSPVNAMVGAEQKMQEMRTQMERIDDVMEYSDDRSVTYADEPDDGGSLDKLKGKIEIKNVSFGYSKMKPPVVRDLSITVDVGKSVAIVGASGCGKSSAAKLISGLYAPWSGEILFDGKPISEIPRSVFTSSVAVVDQDITLFEGSIAENIKMWDKSIEDFEMVLSAKDASIHELIMSREGGYNGRLAVRGENLSGGQRQCIEIARALAQDPTIMVLDEATSALDAKTEADVVKAIKDRGVTCVVIAHRLSTIRDCDEIIVLNNGEIAERGTHSELLARGGIYKKLVANG